MLKFDDDFSIKKDKNKNITHKCKVYNLYFGLNLSKVSKKYDTTNWHKWKIVDQRSQSFIWLLSTWCTNVQKYILKKLKEGKKLSNLEMDAARIITHSLVFLNTKHLKEKTKKKSN